MQTAGPRPTNPGRFWILNLICVLGVALLVVAIATGGILPNARAATDASRQAIENHALQDSLPQLRAEREQLEETLHDLSASLPQRYDIACPANETLLDTVTRLMVHHDLRLTTFAERGRSEGPTDSHEIEITLQGKYESICSWLDALSRLSRPVRVVTLQLSPHGQQSDECQLRTELHFFQLPITLASRETNSK
jgi:Tfp pilus assembly protein PilO